MKESTLVQLLSDRRSTRAFLDKPVAADTVAGILSRAGKSPSGGNLQPWRVYALSGDARQRLINAVSEQIDAGNMEDNPDIAIYPEPLSSPYRDRRFECGIGLYKTLGIARDDKAGRMRQWRANYDFFGAPVGLIFTLDRQMGRAQFLDLGIYLQSVMLLAQEAGLNSCPQLSWSSWAETVRGTLGLGQDEMVIVGMALGYGDPKAEVNGYRTTRAGVDEYATLIGF